MTLDVKPFGETTFGAEVSGVDLTALDQESWATIESAFHEHGVLVFHDQQLSRERHMEFAGRFGALELNDDQGLRPDLAGTPIVIDISNVDENGETIRDRNHPQTRYLGGNEGWHSDSSFKPVTAKASVLHALEVPATGGADTPSDMKGAWHPLVVQHPVTGRRSLFIGRHACQIEGMDVAEGQQLLARLLEEACQPPRIYYHSWRPGDVVVWDNRCMAHRATEWDLDQRRVLRHVRVAGDGEPTGPAEA